MDPSTLANIAVITTNGSFNGNVPVSDATKLRVMCAKYVAATVTALLAVVQPESTDELDDNEGIIGVEWVFPTSDAVIVHDLLTAADIEFSLSIDLPDHSETAVAVIDRAIANARDRAAAIAGADVIAVAVEVKGWPDSGRDYTPAHVVDGELVIELGARVIATFQRA